MSPSSTPTLTGNKPAARFARALPKKIVRALTLLLALAALGSVPASRTLADSPQHCLWELRGKHNTVYLLGSIHVLRPTDYPLAPAVLDAYASAKSILMEIDLTEIGGDGAQAEMMQSAMLRDGKSLPQVLGPTRYAHASGLAHEVGVELSLFDQFAPWFAAEAISQLQLAQLGFQPESGVEMYFMDRARSDGKSVSGLETVHDQLELFETLSADAQADYLMSSLEQAHELPKQVDGMVHAWQRGDTAYFAEELKSDLGDDPRLFQALLAGRNHKWLPKIEALLNGDSNVLVIVGTGHLAGHDSVIDLLRKDGVSVTQR